MDGNENAGKGLDQKDPRQVSSRRASVAGSASPITVNYNCLETVPSGKAGTGAYVETYEFEDNGNLDARSFDATINKLTSVTWNCDRPFIILFGDNGDIGDGNGNDMAKYFTWPDNKYVCLCECTATSRSNWVGVRSAQNGTSYSVELPISNKAIGGNVNYTLLVDANKATARGGRTMLGTAVVRATIKLAS